MGATSEISKVRPLATLVLIALVLGGCTGNGAPVPPGPDLREAWAEVGDGPVSVTQTPDGRTRTAFFRRAYDPSIPFAAAARDFLDENGPLLGLDASSDLALIGVVPYGVLGELAVFRLEHRGVPVYGAGVRVVGIGGAIRFVLVRVPPPFAIDTTPALDAAAVAARAAELHGLTMTPAADPRLVILDTGLLARGPGTGAGGEPSLAWELDVPTTDEDLVVRDFLSADSGRILLAHPLVHAVRDRRVFDGRSSLAVPEIIRASTSQWLNETGAIAGVTIDPANADAYRDAEDAHSYAGQLYNFWINSLRMDSFDGAGAPIRMFVNYRDLRTESDPLRRGHAFWYPRAAGDSVGLDGGAFFFDVGMVGKDFFAHEYTHAVLDFATRSPPVYANESGAVEESLADTFGALLDEEDPWVLGEGTAIGVVRSPPDPHTSTPWQPACYGERFVATSEGPCEQGRCGESASCVDGQCLYDGGGVHINSGIGNRALYLMMQGSTSVPFDAPCELRAGPAIMDRYKVAAFYALAIGLVDEHVSFFDLRAYVLAACRLLAEARFTPLSASSEVTMSDCASVINAFASVDIGEPDTDLDGWDDREDNCPMHPNSDQASGACMAGTPALVLGPCESDPSDPRCTGSCVGRRGDVVFQCESTYGDDDDPDWIGPIICGGTWTSRRACDTSGAFSSCERQLGGGVSDWTYRFHTVEMGHPDYADEVARAEWDCHDGVYHP